MTKTKKVGLTGKYGVRYGRMIRERVKAQAEQQQARHPCPACLRPAVERQSAGIWACGKCGHKFAGKAYKPA
ncbi:MAG: 50S ribosomal protein L37ae [Candidatus Aenigmarchaeota archaeon]|nr:50S ribosomal protein L37ae [Candidatus Aenigmarchaeota archaeon]